MKLRLRLIASSVFSLSASLYSALVVSSSAQAQPVRGLYVTGSGGTSFNQDQVVRLNSIMPAGRDVYRIGETGIGSIGYGLGNGFRVEIEGNYRNNSLKYQNLGTYKAYGHGSQQTYGFMANALFDMDIGNHYIFPYFGAGIGYGWSTMNGVNLYTNDNRLTEKLGGTFGNFSYQAIGGLSFPTPWIVGLSFVTEYRFWTMLAPQSHTADFWGTQGGYNSTHEDRYGRGNRDTTTYFNHSLLLGLRYEFNPAPPPETPVSNPTPEVPHSRNSQTYLIFFNWNSADLDDRARAIVREAALGYSSVQHTRIEVNGYTDNSGSQNEKGKRYNIELSLKRAKAIRAELIKNGIAASEVDIHGFGSENPLKKTSENTREAQNRRVEIIIH